MLTCSLDVAQARNQFRQLSEADESSFNHSGLYGFLYSWGAAEWGACSKSCGKLGIQIRVVQCIQHLPNGTNQTVHTKYCVGDKPDIHRPCSRVPCPPQWRTGAWSQVRFLLLWLLYLGILMPNGKIAQLQ